MYRHSAATDTTSLPWFLVGGGGGMRIFVLLLGSR
jgi:hypothetical protein